MHGLSYHSQPRKSGKAWNSVNEGVALRAIYSDEISGQLGIYNDSVFQLTYYGVIDYTPFSFNKIHLGGFAGDKYSNGHNMITGGGLARLDLDKFNVTSRLFPAPQSKGIGLALEVGYTF